MSTTLTNGLKLPDKGSVDWYADMQNNYTILDGAVGTIADHTTAIAGKAASSHTHTKSDVTDLFNSANTWTALNTYSNGQIRIKSLSQEIGVTPASSIIQYLEFADKNDAQYGKVGLWNYDNGASEIQMSISDKYKNGAKDSTGTSDTAFLSFGFQYNGTKFITFSGQVNNSVIPLTNNTYDLGSSSYQWNNLYAKNYYYNGVAWGLDKANTWTGTNNFKNSIGVTTPQNTDITTNPSTEITGYGLGFWDNNRYWFDFHPQWATDGSFRLVTGISNWQSPSVQGWWALVSEVSKDFGTFNFWTTHGNANLGTATAKWKTLNGVNPGALSLPGEYSSSVTEYITDKTGGNNGYTAPADGWVGIQASSATLDSTNFIFMGRISDGSTYFAQNTSSSITAYWGNQYHGCIILPVTSGTTYGIRCKCDTVDARFYKANGNVS